MFMSFVEWEERQHEQEIAFPLLTETNKQTLLNEFGLIREKYPYQSYIDITNKSKEILGPEVTRKLEEAAITIYFLSQAPEKNAHIIGAAITLSAINIGEPGTNYLSHATSHEFDNLTQYANSIAKARFSRKTENDTIKIAYPIVPDFNLWTCLKEAGKTIPLDIPRSISGTFNAFHVHAGGALMYQLLREVKKRVTDIQTASDV